MNLYLFNPENDLAIAFGGENYTPPPAAQLIGKELSALPLWYAVFLWDKDTEKGKRLYRTNVFVFPVGLLTPSIYTNIGLFPFVAKCR